MIRTRDAHSTESLVASVRGTAREIDPNWPMAHVRTMTEQVADSVARPRFQAMLLARLFGAGAVARRSGNLWCAFLLGGPREIGIRSALGAVREIFSG